jgi:hypothetical protein
MRKLVLAVLVMAALGLLAGQGADQTPSQPGTAGEGLPFTGPHESLLSLGVALTVVGAGVVGVTRYRGRHATR